MADADKNADDFIRDYRQHLSEIDEVSGIILRGHLDIEGLLDDVVELIFFHPEHVGRLRLEFHQKLAIARAYAPYPNAEDWQVVECLNEARNSMVHRRTSEQRAAKIKKVRASIMGRGTKMFRADVEAADDREIVVLAAATAGGFLMHLYDSVLQVRKILAKSLDVPKPSPAIGE